MMMMMMMMMTNVGTRRRRRLGGDEKAKLLFFLIFAAVQFQFQFQSSTVVAERIFDTETLTTETHITRAGQNLTLACPGVTEHSMVLSLLWTCTRCHPDPPPPITSTPPTHSPEVSGTKLVEFRGESTTVWHNAQRLSLATDTYGLNFQPVVGADSGHYECLVNNRPLPQAIVQLVVQDVPERPGRPFISSYTSRSVNISWAPPVTAHNSRILHYLINTRVGEDGEWNDTGIITNNHTSHQILALEPFTVYSFRVSAINGIGTGAWSKESYYCVTLREVPEGKPTISSAMNASSSKIRVTFKPPPITTIHGEFLGYRLVYRPRHPHPHLNQSPASTIHEIYIRDPNVQSYTIDNLMTFTQYLVSLQVFNPEGLGPSTTVAVITDEGGKKPFP